MYDFPNHIIDFSPGFFIKLHIDSIGPAFGAIVVGIVLFYTLVNYLYSHGDAVTSSIITLQFSFFLLLLGYTLYSSSTTIGRVDFWTRVSYMGFSISPIFGVTFIEAVLKRSFTKIKYLVIFNCLVCIFLVWYDNKWIITHALKDMREEVHPTMAKGMGFNLLLLYIMGALLICYIIFIRYYFKHPECRSLYWPLAAGFTGWASSGFYGALNATGIISLVDFPWVGPVIMMLASAIYQGNLLSKRSEELENVIKEKDILYEQMIHDNLTGIMNRNYLIHTLALLLDSLSFTSQEHCLLFIDLDNFKMINERFGHQGGDLMLQLVGKILNETCRKSDIPSRFGGDEFLVYLSECTEEQAIKIAKRIQDRYANEFLSIIDNVTDISPGLSIGISSSRYWNNTISEIIEQPDFAMYEAKRAGKNRIGVYVGYKCDYEAISYLAAPLIKLV